MTTSALSRPPELETVIAARTARDPGSPEELALHLALGLRLLRQVAAFASQLDLGDIELPPAQGSDADRELLRAAAPLYLAAELESTRLLPVVEVLAGLAVSGGLQRDLGSAGPALVSFWRERRDRLSVEEREAIFGRVFGKSYGPPMAEQGARNAGFETLMTEFVAAVSAFGDGPWVPVGTREEMAVAAAGRALASNLLPRTGGMVSFAAQEILETVQEALEILKAPGIQRAVGASSVWQAVRLGARRYLGRESDVTSHLMRGKAGLKLIGWLAENLPTLESFGAITVPVPLVTQAVSWLQGTLALEERRTATRTR